MPCADRRWGASVRRQFTQSTGLGTRSVNSGVNSLGRAKPRKKHETHPAGAADFPGPSSTQKSEFGSISARPRLSEPSRWTGWRKSRLAAGLTPVGAYFYARHKGQTGPGQSAGQPETGTKTWSASCNGSFIHVSMFASDARPSPRIFLALPVQGPLWVQACFPGIRRRGPRSGGDDIVRPILNGDPFRCTSP